MEEKKDNNITIRQDSLSDRKALNNSHIYGSLDKRTEKLITALYMVTDCVVSDRVLKTKLRSLGVDLLSDIYKLYNIPSFEKVAHLNISIQKVNEILSFVDISSVIGFISEMNASILKREFSGLISDLEEHLTEKQIILDKSLFDVPKEEKPSFINKRQSEVKRTFSKGHNNSFNNQSKNERKDKIVSLFKENYKGQNSTGFSIKDISNNFLNYSEKTIQRDLNDLTSKGTLMKKGKKRWSKYFLVD